MDKLDRMKRIQVRTKNRATSLGGNRGPIRASDSAGSAKDEKTRPVLNEGLNFGVA